MNYNLYRLLSASLIIFDDIDWEWSRDENSVCLISDLISVLYTDLGTADGSVNLMICR